MRTAALDFNPLARPAPITMASNVVRHLYPSVSREDIDKEKTRQRKAKAIVVPDSFAGQPTPSHVVRAPAKRKESHHRETYEKRAPDGHNNRSALKCDWAQACRAMMAASGIGQKLLARRLGVARSSVQAWLNGKGVPSPESAKRFAGLYREILCTDLPTE